MKGIGISKPPVAHAAMLIRSSAADRDDSQDQRPKMVDVGESEIDQTLADSFPASDAPSWTLGVTEAPPRERENDEATGEEPLGPRD